MTLEIRFYKLSFEIYLKQAGNDSAYFLQGMQESKVTASLFTAAKQSKNKVLQYV